jgi:ubiquinol-cytochrome c reductase cytochrome b subunit
MGFTLGIVIVVQIVTGLFISFHYSSDINEAYYSVFFLIREIYYGWSLRFLHSSGASFVFLFVFLHIGRSLFYGSFFYNPNTWFSGILILLLLTLYLCSDYGKLRLEPPPELLISEC